MTQERCFFPAERDEPYSGPLSSNSKTFFDVHMNKLSPETREDLLRHMLAHGLGKQDEGVAFATVLLAVERTAEAIPKKSGEAVEQAAQRMAEILGKLANQTFSTQKEELADLAAQLEHEVVTRIRNTVGEAGSELERRTLSAIKRSFDQSLAAFSSGVAKTTEAAVRKALSTELSAAREEIGKMTSAARDARETIKWLPWWAIGLWSVCIFLIGWAAGKM